MKKIDKRAKAIRHRAARVRYDAKRRTPKWKRLKKNKKKLIVGQKQREQKQSRKPFKPLVAPKLFSLIENTNVVLAYFENAKKELRSGENISLDISEVDTLTPDTIALMVANINDVDFVHNSRVVGNEPKKPNLNKLFRESGFYDHVRTSGFVRSSKSNLLHKEVNRKVVPEVAKKALLVGVKHVFGDTRPFAPLYEILVECMSNTNDHADLRGTGKCNWWLYVYCDPVEKLTSYSFLDLGVGIFKSAIVQNYLKNVFKGTPLYKNIYLVDDLLAGNIKSRVYGSDKEIRGKGIPQIVDHAKSLHFRSFYVITNDVMINLKSGYKEQLKHTLDGTFLYWELQN